MRQPKISVIMPAYNAERYIRQAIDSILAQTFDDFEFIIINDGSIDGTEKIVHSYMDNRILYLENQSNIGVAATLNRGLRHAMGEYIARMDSDDISLPRRFELQVTFLDANPNVAVLGTAAELFDQSGVLKCSWSTTDSEKMREELFFSCGLAHPTVMMRRDVISDLGGYDPEYNGLEDYELWNRVAEHYKITTLPDMLFRYRIHDSQVTKNPSPDYLRRIRCLKERQLTKIGVDPQCDAAQAYYDYCLGKPADSYEKVRLFIQFAELAVSGNDKRHYYKEEFLKNDLKSILVRDISELPAEQQKILCEQSTIISYRDVQKHMLKKTLKRWIGRQ